MRKLSLSMFLVFFITIATIFSLEVHADSLEEDQIKEFIKANNYMPLDQAISEFEQQVQREVSLPSKLPFTPSYQLGKISNEGDLQIHYLSVIDNQQQDFVFYIMYPDSKLDKHLTESDKVITLNDQSKAFYRENSVHLRSLAFKKNGFGYLIGGNPQQNEMYSVEGLLEIANSTQ